MRPRLERLLLGFALGCAAALVAYTALRLLERAFFPEPDPAIVIWSDRSRFLWRALIATYVGGAATFGGYALASRSRRTASDWLARAIALAVVAVLVQGVLWP